MLNSSNMINVQYCQEKPVVSLPVHTHTNTHTHTHTHTPPSGVTDLGKITVTSDLCIITSTRARSAELQVVTATDGFARMSLGVGIPLVVCNRRPFPGSYSVPEEHVVQKIHTAYKVFGLNMYTLHAGKKNNSYSDLQTVWIKNVYLSFPPNICWQKNSRLKSFVKKICIFYIQTVNLCFPAGQKPANI